MSLIDEVDARLKSPTESQFYFGMFSSWQNVSQIAFYVHCRFSVKVRSEYYLDFLNDGIKKGLIESGEFNPLEGDITVRFYRLTQSGERHKQAIEEWYNGIMEDYYNRRN